MWVDRRWGTERCPHCLDSLVVSVLLPDVRLDTKHVCRQWGVSLEKQWAAVNHSPPTPWVVIEVCIALQAGVTGDKHLFTSRILYSSWWDRDRQESEGFSYCVTMWNVLEAAGRDVEDEVRPSPKQQCLAVSCRFLFTLALGSWGVWLQAQVFLFFRLWLALSSFSSLCYFCVTLLNDLNERREIVGGFYPYTFKRN